MNRKIRKILFFLGGLLLSGVLLSAQMNVAYAPGRNALPEIPESWETRQNLTEWIYSSAHEAKNRHPGVFRQNSNGLNVRAYNTVTEDSLYQIFAIESGYGYPLARKGNYIIKRDARDGSYIQVKIFIRNDEGSFIRIFPFQDRSKMDVYLLGKGVYRDLILPLPFNRVLGASLEQILALTATRVDWTVFREPGPGFRGEALLPVIDQLRRRLPDLKDNDDGAMDARGNYVYIEDLRYQPAGEGGFNCSGFAKWVADGFVLPAAGRLLDVAELKTKPADGRGNSWSRAAEDARDPYFGLDWTRALAVSLGEIRDNSGKTYPRQAMDVREVPFFEYKEDVGYPLDELETILYLLARENPDTFYFGSINVPFGEAPVLRQHTHVAVFFPYFTAAGDFRLAVMERNAETSPASLKARYPGAHVHLVRAPAAGDFLLP